VPFQWSVHRQECPEGTLKHYEYLAGDNTDPRIPFAEGLCNAVYGANSVVVYNQSFENSRLNDLARWLPKYGSPIEEIRAKFWDLMVVIRRHLYHHAFDCSFSLKSVLPALVPEMNYETLQVADGQEAGLAWIKSVDPT